MKTKSAELYADLFLKIRFDGEVCYVFIFYSLISLLLKNNKQKLRF